MIESEKQLNKIDNPTIIAVAIFVVFIGLILSIIHVSLFDVLTMSWSASFSTFFIISGWLWFVILELIVFIVSVKQQILEIKKAFIADIIGAAAYILGCVIIYLLNRNLVWLVIQLFYSLGSITCIIICSIGLLICCIKKE